jgi:hypothetical protein
MRDMTKETFPYGLVGASAAVGANRTILVENGDDMYFIPVYTKT